MTMTLISTTTVGSGGAASIDFTSIPATGTDLLIVHSLRSTASNSGDFLVRINSDSTTSNYSDRLLYGNGSSAATTSFTSTFPGFYIGTISTAADTSNTFGNGSLYFPNYTSATAKSMSNDNVDENNSSSANIFISAHKWSGTAAITAIKLIADGGATLGQYSTASLYTITKGSGGATVS